MNPESADPRSAGELQDTLSASLFEVIAVVTSATCAGTLASVIASESADCDPVELMSFVARTLKAKVEPAEKSLNTALKVFAAKV